MVIKLIAVSWVILGDVVDGDCDGDGDCDAHLIRYCPAVAPDSPLTARAAACVSYAASCCRSVRSTVPNAESAASLLLELLATFTNLSAYLRCRKHVEENQKHRICLGFSTTKQIVVHTQSYRTYKMEMR